MYSTSLTTFFHTEIQASFILRVSTALSSNREHSRVSWRKDSHLALIYKKKNVFSFKLYCHKLISWSHLMWGDWGKSPAWFSFCGKENMNLGKQLTISAWKELESSQVCFNSHRIVFISHDGNTHKQPYVSE